MREVVTEIEVFAPAERVWNVLTDFAAYPQWNPYLRRVEGSLAPGTRLDVEAARSDGKARRYNPIVSVWEEGQRFAWRSSIVHPGVLEIVHEFDVGRLERRSVRFVQRESFRGIFAPLGGQALRKARERFEVMNQALKLRAEQQPSA